MKSTVIAGITLILLIYLGFGLCLYVFQRSFLYHPTPAVTNDHYTTIAINGLKIWQIRPNQPQALIYFGGNAEDVEHNLNDYEDMFPDHTLYFVNYRGFGGSPGKPSETMLFEDALAIYDQLPDHESIAVVGRSLGSGVATYLAAQRNVDKLVLVTPYDSITRVAQNMYPLYPVNLLLKDKFESIKYAAHINSEVLIIIAALDKVIPPSHAYRLAEAFPDGKVQIALIEGGDHNGIHNNGVYRDRIMSFLR